MKKELTCRTCETEFFGYSQINGGALLYDCMDCGAIFALDFNDDRPMEEIVKNKSCPDCDAPLAETLEEKTQAGSCPMCEDRDYYGSGDPEEVDLEIYAL